MSFLKRWSQLKRGLRTAPDSAAAPAPSGPSTTHAPSQAPLPALDSLEFSSDFTAFMQADVAEGLRKAALNQLFHHEHFKVMDGLDVYIDDYHSFEPIGAALLQNLNQARGLLWADEQEPESQASAASEPPDDSVPTPSTMINRPGSAGEPE